MAFIAFKMYSHHLHLVPKDFHPPKENPKSIKHLPIPTPALDNHPFLSVWVYPFWLFHRNGIIKYVTFCIWLLSPA